MLKRCLCGVLTICLLLSCTACSAKVDLEEVKADMVTRLQLTPNDLDADTLAQWYGITSNNAEQAVGFMLTEDLFPAEIVMVKAADDDAAAVIAATISRRLSSLKTQSDERAPAALSCTVQQDGRYIAMFFSAQNAAMQAIYDEYF